MEWNMTNEVDQSPVAKLHSDLKNNLNKLMMFWKTKRKIASGMPLWNLTVNERKAEGVLGPWSFTIFEVLIVGVVASVTTNIWVFLYDITPHEQTETTLTAFDVMLTKTSSWVTPFFTPIFTTLYVSLVAWGTLWGEDSSRDSRVRARSAYLYNDVAYGFFAKLILAVGFSVLISDSENMPVSLGVASVIAFFWLGYLGLRFIPRKVFIANGYNGEIRQFWQKPKSDDSPWGKYSISTFIASFPLIAILVTGLWGVSAILAVLLLALKSIVST
jgi:hypothetical protein